jgi:hypothetical protein
MSGEEELSVPRATTIRVLVCAADDVAAEADAVERVVRDFDEGARGAVRYEVRRTRDADYNPEPAALPHLNAWDIAVLIVDSALGITLPTRFSNLDGGVVRRIAYEFGMVLTAARQMGRVGSVMVLCRESHGPGGTEEAIALVDRILAEHAKASSWPFTMRKDYPGPGSFDEQFEGMLKMWCLLHLTRFGKSHRQTLAALFPGWRLGRLPGEQPLSAPPLILDRAPVFVSHAKADAEAARLIVADVERAGIRCWMAPRDIPAGADFQDAIVEALDGASAMILVFSQRASASAHVKNEVVLAQTRGLRIVPLRIENIAPKGAFEYQFSRIQYVDLFEDRDARLAETVRMLRAYLEGPERTPSPGDSPPAPV